jgi:drug/metabolite transporter (DMT)-like permease
MNRAWFFFWLLSLVWGSSFLLMRVVVVEMPPAQLAFMRIGIAAISMNVLMLLTRRRYPTDWRTLLPMIVVGLGNTAIPFTLLAWGEVTVESGTTSVLQAITPAFAVIIAHFMFVDDRITLTKIVGVAVSFVGIIVLASRDLAGGLGLEGDLSGELAILVASFCYALFGSYSRKVLQQQKIETILMSATTMTTAAVGTGLFMFASPLIGEPAPVPLSALSPTVLVSALVLGFVNTFIAYLMFYSIIPQLGASRTSMVTYVIPVVAVTLGAVFLNELIDARLLIGSALILGGIGVVNLRLLGKRKVQPLELAKQTE